MKQNIYKEILDLMHSYKTRNCLKMIAQRYPEVSVNTLGSIYAQDYQRKMKRTYHKLTTPEMVEYYYSRYLEGIQMNRKQVLIKLAYEVKLSPALLARLIAEKYLALTKFQEKGPPKSAVSQVMKDTSLIEDPQLSHEIHMCILSDDTYGAVSDAVKHSVGHEHEVLLAEKAQEKGLAYLDEDQMRARGYDKTPDIKLEIPIAVDGHVVNWIESKASFGDEESHETYLRDQFWSYWNRFGPGLVIYWFGFIEELDTNVDKGILLMDHFPEEITSMNPELL